MLNVKVLRILSRDWHDRTKETWMNAIGLKPDQFDFEMQIMARGAAISALLRRAADLIECVDEYTLDFVDEKQFVQMIDRYTEAATECEKAGVK